LIRSTMEIIVRTSDWSSTTRTRVIEVSRTGRPAAYDENCRIPRFRRHYSTCR
jgi:hypothetical protein